MKIDIIFGEFNEYESSRGKQGSKIGTYLSILSQKVGKILGEWQVKRRKHHSGLRVVGGRDNKPDHAMAPGGIDFNSANLSLQIKRDGRGVPLPLALQDMAQLSRIQGFVPEIIEIKPAGNLPILSELQQKLQSSAT